MIVSKISVVSVVSDEIISYLVLEISVVSVVTGEIIFYVLCVVSKFNVVSDEIISGIQNQRSYRSQRWNYFSCSIEYQRSQRS